VLVADGWHGQRADAARELRCGSLSTIACRAMSATARSHRKLAAQPGGFTVLEVMVAIAVLAVLAVIATGQYGRYMERLRITRAILDIGAIEGHLAHFEANNRGLPDSLSELGVTLPLDPWGRPYEYLNHATAEGKGGFRKDKNIVPINTDYDLYSVGPDGVSVPPLTAKQSRDDIVRANDGRFIGSVPDYDP
jgi:general secretion pathway protein G